MKTVILYTENAAFKFDQNEVTDHLIRRKTEFHLDEISQFLELISTGGDETILSSVDLPYFGYIVLNLIGSGRGIVDCKLCGKTYDAGQLKQFAIGHGRSSFDIKQKMKGGFSQFEKRKNPSMFGGTGYKCPAGHTLTAMETWRT